jgi:hypothetical protein
MCPNAVILLAPIMNAARWTKLFNEIQNFGVWGFLHPWHQSTREIAWVRGWDCHTEKYWIKSGGGPFWSSFRNTWSHIFPSYQVHCLILYQARYIQYPFYINVFCFHFQSVSDNVNDNVSTDEKWILIPAVYGIVSSYGIIDLDIYAISYSCTHFLSIYFVKNYLYAP